MPLQTKRVKIAKQGINTFDNAVDFTGDYSPYIKNMMIEGGILRKFAGYSAYPSSESFDFQPLGIVTSGEGIFEFHHPTGDIYPIIATKRDMFIYDFAVGFRCITPGALVDAASTGYTEAHVSITVDYFNSGNLHGTCLRMSNLAAEVSSDATKIAYTNFSSADLSAHTFVSGWIKVDSVTFGTGNLVLVISDAADGAKSGNYVEVNIPVDTTNTWKFFSVEVDLSALTAAVSLGIWNGTELTWPTGSSICLSMITVNTPMTAQTNAEKVRVAHVTDENMFDAINEQGTALVLANNADDLVYFAKTADDLTGFFKTLVHLMAGFEKCCELIEFYNYFMVTSYYITDIGYFFQSIEHSGAGNVDDHVSMSSGNYTLTDTVGRILRIFKIENSLIIMATNSILIGDFLGSATKFTFRPIAVSFGLLSPDAVCVVNDAVFFISSDHKVYIYKLSTGFIEIGRPISRTLESLSDNPYAYRVFYSARNRRVFFGANISVFKGYALNLSAEGIVWEYFELSNKVEGSLAGYEFISQ